MTSEGVTAEIAEWNGLRMKLFCTAEQNGTITLPQINYENIVAMSEDNQTLIIGDNQNNQVMIQIPADFHGKIIFDYREPVLWCICEGISVLRMICCTVLICRGQ